MPPKAKAEQTDTSGKPIQANPDLTPWQALAAPFPEDEIELLPRALRKDDRPLKAKCDRPDVNGVSCGGFHVMPAIHLHYVGHAGVTMRLNQVDPTWTWEPMALTEQGTPLFSDGGLWIRLTVLGVTRIGYGDAAGKSGPNAVKEAIGDAIRNVAMRFGVGTYLWSKSDKAKALATSQEGADFHDAQPAQARAQQDAAAEAPASTPHPAIQEITEGIGHLLDHQRAWLIEQWTTKGWPPLRSWTAEDTPESAPTEARALLKAASEQPDPSEGQSPDEPPF